jgi:hypothetical protein
MIRETLSFPKRDASEIHLRFPIVLFFATFIFFQTFITVKAGSKPVSSMLSDKQLPGAIGSPFKGKGEKR